MAFIGSGRFEIAEQRKIQLMPLGLVSQKEGEACNGSNRVYIDMIAQITAKPVKGAM
jgi:hypothetical protein